MIVISRHQYKHAFDIVLHTDTLSASGNPIRSSINLDLIGLASPSATILQNG